MTRVVFVLMVIWCAVLTAPAAVVEWRQNHTIEVVLEPSIPQRDHRSRLVYFPSEQVHFTQDWSQDDLHATVMLNGIQFMLRNPEFQTTVHVIGNDGAIYPLRIRRSAEDEDVSTVLQVVPHQPETSTAGSSIAARGPADIDAEAVVMMRHMVSGEPQHWVTSSPDGEITDEGFRLGRRVYESDFLSITSTRLYRGLQTVGYQCLVEYRGAEPVRLNFQRLYFPGALCVYASHQVLMDPKHPGTVLEPGDRLVLWFVARASE